MNILKVVISCFVCLSIISVSIGVCTVGNDKWQTWAFRGYALGMTGIGLCVVAATLTVL